MTDKDMLEAAAKAAGIAVRWNENPPSTVMVDDIGDAGWWNPLTDDGDALRLAVRLGISFRRMGGKVIAIGHTQCDEYCNDDAEAATRRAIVRAAAAMAKA